jgi:anaphase-promoting complex subunit 4
LKVRLHRITHGDAIDNINAAITASYALNINLPSAGSILDVKFVDDEQILVLWQSESGSAVPTSPRRDLADEPFRETAVLLSLPYNGSPNFRWTVRPDAPFQPPVPYQPRMGSGDVGDSISEMALPAGHAGGRRPVWDLSDPDAPETQRFVRHVFSTKERFIPVKLEVNGRQHRRVAVVLGEGLKTYKILDLDHGEKEGDVKE